jgi:gas vesicle protein
MNKEEKNKKSGGKMLAAIVVGGAIGSVLGLAFAPNKGNKFRKKMKAKIKEVGEDALEKIKDKIDEAK